MTFHGSFLLLIRLVTTTTNRIVFYGYHQPVFFIKTLSLGRLPTKAQDSQLAMKHGYTLLDANPVFLNHRVCLEKMI